MGLQGIARDMTIGLDAGRSDRSEDQLLLSRIARQDRRAFEALYRRYYQRVFHFVVRIVRRESAAEEVVSDVMFAVWQGAATFVGGSSVSTWVLGIAYRQAMKLIEKDRKHSRVDSNDELIADTVDSHPDSDPAHVALTDSEAALLQKAIDALSEPHRVVVELTATGHSYGEIAEIVGCPENTVKTRMFHARQQLKRHLGSAQPANGEDSGSRSEFIPLHGAANRPGNTL
jgi:RNA polymerase sigma-70 factor (ECF subfamily)